MWDRRRRQSSVWNTHQDQTNCIGWDMILMLWKRWQFHMKLWLSITQQQFHINKIGENIYISQPVESFTSKNSKKPSLSLDFFCLHEKNFVKKSFSRIQFIHNISQPFIAVATTQASLREWFLTFLQFPQPLFLCFPIVPFTLGALLSPPSTRWLKELHWARCNVLQRGESSLKLNCWEIFVSQSWSWL